MSPPSFVSAVLALVTLAGLGVATLLDMADGPGTARQERVAPTPELPRSAADMVRFATDARFYVANRYALKDRFVAWNGWVKIGLFGHSPAPNVGFGQEGFLFLVTDAPVAIAQGQDRLGAGAAKVWRDHFATVRETFADRGIDYAFITGPNKHSVYPDLLPNWLEPVPPDQTLTADIARATDGVLPASVDSGEVLRQARADDPEKLLYHPTDTHWTEWGAALVLDQALTSLGVPSKLPAVMEADLPRSGDMARMIGQQDAWTARAPVLTADYSCTDASGALVEIATIDPLIPRSLTCGSPEGRPERLVVFHDSFGVPAIPYLAARFARVEFIATDAADPDRAAELGADIALQIIVERKFQSARPSDFIVPRGGAG